jgi:hypothetical protein
MINPNSNITSLDAFHTYIKTIRNVSDALEVFMSIKTDASGQALKKTHESLELIISMICSQRQWSLADKIIHYMRSEHDVHPNAVVHKDLIKFSSFAGYWIEGRRFLTKQLKHASNDSYPPPKSYMRVMRAMSKAEVWREVTSFYKTTFKDSPAYLSMSNAEKLEYLFEPMLLYNAKYSRWREAVSWMNEIKAIGLTPSRACYRHTIEACTKASKQDIAKIYLDELERTHNFK